MSKAEHMGISPSQVSCHSKSYSCPKQITLENTQEFSAERKSGEVLEQKHNLESEFIQTDAEDGSTAILQSYAGEILQPSAEDVRKSSVTDLDPPPNDVLVDKSSGHILTVIDQKLKQGCRSTHAACAQSESLKARDSGIVKDGLRDISTTLPGCIANENLRKSPEVLASNPPIEEAELPHVDASKSSQIDNSSYPQQAKSGEAFDFAPVKACREPSEERLKPDSEVIQNESVGTGTGLPSGIAIEWLEPVAQLVTESSSIVIGLPAGGAIHIHANEESQKPSNDVGNKYFNVENSEAPSGHMPGNSSDATCMVKITPKLSRKKKYMLRSLRKSERVLRSRSQEKPKSPEPSNNLANVGSTGEKKRRGRKKGKKGKRTVADEYSSIRARLRYLLNRMSYEQSLITAYSSEGWKGLSLEKLKPEKELQRATSEIFRRKLKIRDLFQHIDSLCAEGRFPASLFDSEGQISSEDIFCAKCGSKDLTADNDIVLCDGACDRGFHQFCLIPPLLKEDIPPDDEGWLCPGCDCKVDCIRLLNDSQGTNLSISDSWQEVFPEAVAAAGGQKLYHKFGLSSDDSDDNDYDPDGPDIDENCQEAESSSDESDFSSASDELVASPDDKQHLGLPSDDSEDDDFDPDAPDLNEKLKQESSSSDFTSDSEDLATTLNDGFSAEDDSHTSIEPRRDSFGRRSKLSGKKKQSLNSELLTLLEPDPGQDVSASVSGKRNVERLDYKKLYDETYGTAATSSDDDYTDSPGPRKRRREITENNSTVSINGDGSMTQNGLNTKDMNKEKPTPKKRIQQKSSVHVTNVSPAKTNGRSSGSGSKPRHGEAVTQRLYNFFKENQYPDRAAKESLAKELGITFVQVNKWFTNARWSFHHPSS